MPQHYARFDAPDLTPVIATEITATGWRGLTQDGEILNVTTHVNGAPVEIPERLSIMRRGEIIGYRAVAKPSEGVIETYQRHLVASNTLTRANEHARALEEIDAALIVAPTIVARFNRGIMLLAVGRWQEGFEELNHCERNSPVFMRPQYFAAVQRGLTPWYGENIAGKKLLLIHDHGFGDTLMMLRYVAQLKAMGAEVVLQMPPEMERLAAQVAPVTRELVDADYVCSIFLMMQYLRGLTAVITSDPYLHVDELLAQKWRQRIAKTERKRIGVAWSVGVAYQDDYPRSVPLGLFVKALAQEADLFSVQQQGAAEAAMLGVGHFQFDDFADCAALMSILDEIVTVDTAAVHLAGAIGHPHVSLLLSHWSSWRWQAPLYRNVRLCRQDSAGDWESAFAKRK